MIGKLRFERREGDALVVEGSNLEDKAGEALRRIVVVTGAQRELRSRRRGNS